MDNIITQDLNLDLLDNIDDEIDCAIMSDPQFIEALSKIEAQDYLEDEDEPTDLTVDYTDELVEPDIVSTDADDLLAAERDIAFDPFEDDELMDSIPDSDEEIEIEDDEDIVPEDDVLEEI